MTTREEISAWFDRGVKQNATHMIVACDTFDYDDYPVFCTGTEETLRRYGELNGKNMQRVMEVYDLTSDKMQQLNEHRVFRLPTL